MIPVLLFQQHMDQYGGEIFRNGGVLPPGGLTQLVQRHKAHGNVERIERFGGAGVGIGLGHPPQAQRVVSGVSDVGILQLLLPGRFVQIQHAVSGGDIRAGLPQVFRQQRPKKYQRTGPVRQRVKDLQRDPVPIVIKAYQPAVVLPEAHRLARVGNIGLQEGAGRGVWLQIIPEQPPADADGKAGKPGHNPVNGILQGGGAHRLIQQSGKAVNGGVLFPLQGGIENPGIIQPVPMAVRLCHLSHLLMRDLRFIVAHGGKRGKARQFSRFHFRKFYGILIENGQEFLWKSCKWSENGSRAPKIPGWIR